MTSQESSDLSIPAQQVITVSELTSHIKAVVEGTFPSLWVAGEISDLARPRSGHLYFTLKDDDAQIRGILWRTTASRLGFEVEDGQAVICFGDLEVYPARGTYQLVVRKIEPQGLGALQLAFQQLQAKLYAEGLFAAERKRRLPKYPRRIGIVTSPSGAAVRDFLEAAANRWRGVEIIVIPAQVQGQAAASSIVAALRAAERIKPSLDVVIVSRGGGSLDDLWCFNEEPVVRAVAASKLPTVSAVGHEIDVTLCDLAADVRALTPTDAATVVLPDAQLIDRSVTNLVQRLNRSMRLAIVSRRTRIESLSGRTMIRKPMEIVHLRSRRLDELDARAKRAIEASLLAGKAKLQMAAASLSALSPLSVLARGYSVTTGPDGKTVTDARDLTLGQAIRTRFDCGIATSTVTEIDVGPDAD